MGRAAPTRSPNGVTGCVSPVRRRVAADLKRIAPQVVTVQFDEVEGVESEAVIAKVRKTQPAAHMKIRALLVPRELC